MGGVFRRRSHFVIQADLCRDRHEGPMPPPVFWLLSLTASAVIACASERSFSAAPGRDSGSGGAAGQPSAMGGGARPFHTNSAPMGDRSTSDEPFASPEVVVQEDARVFDLRQCHGTVSPFSTRHRVGQRYPICVQHSYGLILKSAAS